MITGDQIVAHLVGEYLVQNTWLKNKRGGSLLHGLAYACAYVLPFLFLTRNVYALAAIAGVQALIDYRGGVATRLLALREKYGTDTYQPNSYKVLHVAAIEAILSLLANGLILKFIV